MSKPCPECKSKNTKQLEKETYGDFALCLSCYNKFKSYSPIIKMVRKRNTKKKIQIKEEEINIGGIC